jgi:hypothetical protein
MVQLARIAAVLTAKGAREHNKNMTGSPQSTPPMRAFRGGPSKGWRARVTQDLIVLATGYRGQEHLVSKLFGDKVAARVGAIWGFGDGAELPNMFTRTPQPGLWFIAGSFAQCRIYSKYLALQIKACEIGLLQANAPRSASGRSQSKEEREAVRLGRVGARAIEPCAIRIKVLAPARRLAHTG